MTALSPTGAAILGLVAWFAFLLFLLEATRSYATVTKGKPANSFAPEGTDLSPFARRLTRAHANAYEFLPFPLAVLVYAVAVDATEITNELAIWLLTARIGQSLVHLASVSVPAVLIRFVVFFIPQQIILILWVYRLMDVG